MSQRAEPDSGHGAALLSQSPVGRRKGYKMYEATPCLQPLPETDGSHQAWPTTPVVHKHAPVTRQKREMLQRQGDKRGPNTSEGVLYLWRGVFQYYCEEGESGRPADRGVRDEGGPVSIQGSLLYTFCQS